MKSTRVCLDTLKWVALEGAWEQRENELVLSGFEYDAPQEGEVTPGNQDVSQKKRIKYLSGGTALFGTNFQEGRIGASIEFAEADHRSIAGLILQYDPETGDMLTFNLTGGGLVPTPGVAGYMFKLQTWGAANKKDTGQRSVLSKQRKVWTTIFEVGVGTNLKKNRPYKIEIFARGGVVTLYADEVEIGRHNLETSSLLGLPCGLFCLGSSEVHFRDVFIETKTPRAFIAMQFQTPEYEALFKEVIDPICRSAGLEAYRADSTYLPGPIVEDIKKQIRESRVVIAEITPQNPNVYYEVGYADALNKPIILISDRKEGLKPFDVRSYRTLFYDNSIGGKRQVENDLKAYLQAIMAV